MAKRFVCLLACVCVFGVANAEKPPAVQPDESGGQVFWSTAIGESAKMVVDANGKIDMQWTATTNEVRVPQARLPRVEGVGVVDMAVPMADGGPAQVMAPIKTTNNGLDINGDISYLVQSGVLQFWADEVANTRSSGTSGSLKLQLWATADYPVFGNTLNGTILGSYDLNPLAAGWHYTNIYSGTLPFNAPPVGCWWITMVLVEYIPPWSYQDLRTFSSQEDFGTGACVGCVDDNWEPDDTCVTGSQIQTGTYQTHKHCDVDWVYVNAVQGRTYTFETNSLVGGADTIIELYDDCGPLLTTDDDSGPGLGSKIIWTATHSGILDLKIREYQEDYQNGMGYNVAVTTDNQPPPGNCLYEQGTLYLHNGRFMVTGAAFLNGNPVNFFLQNLCPNDQPSPTSAAFYFNTAWPPVEEGFVSVRNACSGPANAYVVEVACASTRKFWVDVTDTWTGVTRRYQNPTGGSSTFFPADRTSFRTSCP